MQKSRHFRGFNNVERVMGIEPTYPAWEAGVLPLNYTRTFSLCLLFYHRVLIYASAFYYV